jgi:hypothetical protein
MDPGQKSVLGMTLLVVGGIWFFLDLIGLPPAFAIISAVSSTDFMNSYGRFFLQLVYVMSSNTLANGFLMHRSSYRKLNSGIYLRTFGAAALAWLWVFMTYEWFPFSK